MAAKGQISVTQPINRRYKLEQTDEAYQVLNRGEIVGRAIVAMGWVARLPLTPLFCAPTGERIEGPSLR